MNAPHGKST